MRLYVEKIYVFYVDRLLFSRGFQRANEPAPEAFGRAALETKQ